MRLLHLSGPTIKRYTKNEIRDLVNYLEPQITLTTKTTSKEAKKIEEANPTETIHLNNINKYTKRNWNQETLLIIKDPNIITKIELDELNNEVIVVTDQIRETTDFSSFDVTIEDNGLINKLKNELNNFKIFSSNLEADEKINAKENTIHGLKTIKNQYGETKIPLIKTSGTPQITTLPTKRVGIQAIPGMGNKFVRKLEKEGIKTREELCQIQPQNIMKHEGIGPYRGTKWITKAKAIENQQIYRIKENNLKNKHRIFIDIETDSLNPEIIWHIGTYNDSKKEYKYFLEKKPQNKQRIIKEFTKYLEKNKKQNTCLLAWYGSKFDFKILKRFISQYSPKKLSTWKELEKIDFMEWTKNHTATPCRTQKLEHVANKTGHKTNTTGLNGEQVGSMYTNYMTGEKKELNWKKLKKYGKDDVMAMKHIYDNITKAPKLHDIDEISKEYRKNRSNFTKEN